MSVAAIHRGGRGARPRLPGDATPSAPHAGFTLVELVISMALLSLVFLLSAQLFTEAGHAFRVAGRQALEPHPEWAAEQLRQDLRDASAAGAGPAGVWRSDPLLLTFPEQAPLRWRLEADGSLVRERESPLGWLPRRQLARVSDLRWRRLPGGLVEVAVTYRHRGGPWGRQITAPRPHADPEVTQTLRLLVAVRGAGRSRGW